MDLRDKLKSEIQECDWDLLVDNIKRECVFKVDQSLDLLDVAIGIANDNSQLVGEWLQREELKKVLLEDKDILSKFSFKFLIIQPYVIIQRLHN